MCYSVCELTQRPLWLKQNIALLDAHAPFLSVGTPCSTYGGNQTSSE